MSEETILFDSADRDTARFELGYNIIVEAGAGTGKTTLLIDRICFWLLSREKADISEMAALTFTEKAAAEIRLRLAKRLHLVAGGADIGAAFAARLGGAEEAAKRARFVLEQLDRAQIGTIHSFASHILRLYPIEAGLDPSVIVDEGAGFDSVFESEWRRWLNSELGEGSVSAEQWKTALKTASVDELAGLARVLCSEKLADYAPGFLKEELAALCAEKAERAERLAVSFLSGGKPRQIEKSLEAAALRLRRISGCDATSGAEPSDCKLRLPLPSGAAKGWPDDSIAEARRIIAFANTANPFSQRFVEHCVKLLEPFKRIFSAAYRAKGFVSFDGLLVKSCGLLRENAAARATLKKQYKALFIDEFQDTDPLQGELLMLLAEAAGGEAPRWQDARLEPGKLFIVGDPKQSIYRFRGADIGAYAAFTAKMQEQGAKKCYLTSNYRSRPEIIAFVNSVGSRLIKQEPGIQPEYIPINAAAEFVPGCGPAVEVIAVAAESGEHQNAGDLRQRQAAFIADWIAENTAGPAARCRLKDIAILLRSMSPLWVFLEALRRQGIRYIVEEDRYFYGTQEVTDLLNLLRIVCDPQDCVAMTGILRSPLGGLSDAQLIKLRERSSYSYMEAAPVGFSGLEEFYVVLRNLRAVNGRVPLRELAEAAIDETRMLELLPAAYSGEQTISNILKFKKIISDYGDSGGGLNEFLARAKGFVEDKEREGESPLCDESLDAVSILTVHKAKGLEYPVVLVPNISSRTGGGAKKPAVISDRKTGGAGLRICGHADCLMAALEERESAHEAAEERRAFYVAATRAKEKLVFVGNEGDSPEGSFAAYLAACSSYPGGEACGTKLEGVKFSILPPEETRAPRVAKAAETALPAKAQAGVKAWKTAWENRRELADSLAGARVFASASGAKDGREYIRDEAGTPAPREDAILLGRLCHKVLERHQFGAGITADEINDAARFLQPALSPGVIAQARDMLQTFSKSGAYAFIAESEILCREFPFIYSGGEAPFTKAVRGVIDIVVKHKTGIFILDYKSDAIASQSEPQHAAAYAAQAAIYKKAVSRILGAAPPGFQFVFLRTARAVPV